MCEVCYANRAPKSLHFFPCWGPVRCSCGCLIPHISLCSRCWKGLKDINTRPRTTVNPTWSEHGQKAMFKPFQPSADQTTISSTFNLQCINLVFSIRMAGKVTMGIITVSNWLQAMAVESTARCTTCRLGSIVHAIGTCNRITQ